MCNSFPATHSAPPTHMPSHRSSAANLRDGGGGKRERIDFGGSSGGDRDSKRSRY